MSETVAWIAHNVIANEIKLEPLPEELFQPLAALLVNDEFFGWPDVEEAKEYLRDEFDWAAA